jgi:transcriptional regulator with XRE-family HTH domain
MPDEKALDVSRQLTKAEREELEDEQKLIQLYEMRTSVERRYTLEEQAQALGVSVSTIKRLAKSERFLDVAQRLAPKTRSVMVDAAREFLQDTLLPLAMTKARDLLEDDRTPAGTKVNIITSIFNKGLLAMEEASSEGHRQDAMEFLKQQGLQAQTINVVINNVGLAPEGYLEGLKAILPDVVDGEVVETAG